MRKQEVESLSSASVRSTHEQASRFWLHGLLSSLFVSNAGTALQLATQAWFVWEVSHRPSTVGVLGLVQATPLLGVPFLGGILADRFPRQRLFMTQGALTLIAALMGSLALVGLLSLPLTLLLSGIMASVSALDNPSRQVYVPDVVDATQRGRMVGLGALTYNAEAIAGPAAAGVLIPLVGVGWCFLLNALSYLILMAWLLVGPVPRPPHHRPENIGMKHAVWSNVSTRTLLVLVAVVSLLGRSYPTVLPILVSTTWGNGARMYGTLAALPGIGAALAAFFVVWVLGPRKRKPPLWLGGTLLGVALVCFGLAGNRVVAGLALLAIGGFATGTMTMLNAKLQELTPQEVRGRVMNLYTWLAAGMPAAGGWLLGTLMGFFLPQLVLILGGISLIGVIVVLSWGARSQQRENTLLS